MTTSIALTPRETAFDLLSKVIESWCDLSCYSALCRKERIAEEKQEEIKACEKKCIEAFAAMENSVLIENGSLSSKDMFNYAALLRSLGRNLLNLTKSIEEKNAEEGLWQMTKSLADKIDGLYRKITQVEDSAGLIIIERLGPMITRVNEFYLPASRCSLR